MSTNDPNANFSLVKLVSKADASDSTVELIFLLGGSKNHKLEQLKVVLSVNMGKISVSFASTLIY